MNSTKYLKRVNTIFYQTIKKTTEEGVLQNLFCNTSIMLILKPDNNITKNNITDEHRRKNL